MFQEYPQDNVNEPLDLYEGGFRVHRGDRIAEGTGSAALRWLPAPSIEIDIEIVWRQFGSPVVDRWTRGRSSWFDERHGALLAELFDAFCRMYNDKSLREPLVVALHWYRHCNTQSSGTEGALVLGMTALDLMSALVVVDRCGSMTANRHDEHRAAQKLRLLLKALGVPADIPPRYASLAA